MSKHAGEYKSKKRKKEILRQKKQEDKRKRRFNKNIGTEQDNEMKEAKEASEA